MGGDVLILSWSINLAVGYFQIGGGHNHAYAIAGRVEDAMADLHLIPIASGDGIVTRVHLASFYLHVLCSTDMDAIPTTLNTQVGERGMVDEIAEEGIVG